MGQDLRQEGGKVCGSLEGVNVRCSSCMATEVMDCAPEVLTQIDAHTPSSQKLCKEVPPLEQSTAIVGKPNFHKEDLALSFDET